MTDWSHGMTSQHIGHMVWYHLTDLSHGIMSHDILQIFPFYIYDFVLFTVNIYSNNCFEDLKCDLPQNIETIANE